MASEKKINERRRAIASRMFLILFDKLADRHPADAARIASQIACDAADALIHEFDERGWQ